MIQLNGKKMSKKAWKIVKSDMFAAVALVSVLMNLFFFSGLAVFSGTNDLDMSVYEAANERLCNSQYNNNLKKEMEESDNPSVAKAKLEITCRQGDFIRYYDNAVQAYLNDAE